MSTVIDFQEMIGDLCKCSIVVSPWLAYIDQKVNFEEEIFDHLYDSACSYTSMHWPEGANPFKSENVQMPARFPITAYYETAVATSVQIAYEKTGTPIVNDVFAQEATDALGIFIEKHGFYQFVSLYALLTAFENMITIDYYREMREADFLNGKLHRPWIGYSLDDELSMYIQKHSIEVKQLGDTRMLSLTDLGRSRLANMRSILEQSGYLKERSKLLRISHFSEMEDYETAIGHLAPEIQNDRAEFLNYANIQSGSNVLEIGCGSGGFTFAGGLADAVGAHGTLVALEPAKGMLQRAEAQGEIQNKAWVSFMLGCAEQLPFADASFDTVVSMLTLHLTNTPQALREIRRVLRPGGAFASFHLLEFPGDIPFLQEWFQPVLERGTVPRKWSRLPEEDTLVAMLQQDFTDVSACNKDITMVYDDPDKVVRLFVEGEGLFDDVLMDLPWRERQRIIEELKENGRKICATRSQAELTVQYPGQMIRCFAR